MEDRQEKTILLGGGCFWCLEAIFLRVTGIYSIVSGYAGGETKNPTYERVCMGSTGHAEVVKIQYAENIISTRSLLEIFFHIHDPTTLNRQGHDVGSQYRSIIFYFEEYQKNVAEKLILEIDASGIHSSKVVTEIKSAEPFYEAEPYHLNYYEKNPNQPYCQAVVGQKLKKFLHHFKQSPLLKEGT